VGKTRLALAVAERLGAGFRWGARLVALAAVDDPAAVPTVVADGLGLSVEEGGAAAALARAGDLDLLIVLDNCEHVIDAAASVAGMLLRGGNRARVLATSRERLGLEGEYTWTLAPLSLTGDDPPARRLFVDRARAARPGAVSGAEDLVAADRIVQRLDGLPLAIEMAAGRAASLPLGELAERLDELGPLTSTRRDTEDRHRTLSAVVEWSEALLSSEERDLLADLSVFAGSMDEADVAAVTGRAAPLDGLCGLAERSLLIADTSGERARFRMLVTIRDHAARRLNASGRADQLAARHARHVVAAAEAADADLRSINEAAAAVRLDALMPDVRSAHGWARRADFPLAIRLTAAMHLFAQSRLRDEPHSWAAELAAELQEAGTGNEPGTPVVLASAAQRAVNAGDLARAEMLAREGVARAKTAGEAFFSLEVLADVALFTGRLDFAMATARQALEAGEEIGDDHAVTFGRSNAALAAAYAGRFPEAEALLRGRWRPPAAPSDLGWLAYTEGEVVLDRVPQRALALLDHAVALAESVGNRYLGGVARVSACSLRARTGDPAQAMGAFASVIEGWRRQGAKVQQLTTLRNLVVLMARMGSAAEAARLLGAVERDTVAPTFGEEAARLARVRSWVDEILGPAEAARHLAAGAELDLDEAAELALSWL
jgi:predicted ATPase